MVAGSSTAQFLVRMPRFTTISKMHRPTLAVPELLAWSADGAYRQILYGIQFELRLNRPRFNFRIQAQDGTRGNEISQVLRRLQSRLSGPNPRETARDFFKTHLIMPTVEVIEDWNLSIREGEDACIRFTLPPFTALCTTDESFLIMLGFTRDQYKVEYTRWGYHEASPDALRTFGFSNDTMHPLIIDSNIRRNPYALLGEQRTQGFGRFPKLGTINIQVEMLSTLEYELTSDAAEGVSNENCVAALNNIFIAVRDRYNLVRSPLEAALNDSNDGIVVKSRPLPYDDKDEAGGSGTLIFNSNFEKVYDSDKGRPYAFTFTEEQNYAFRPIEPRADPFSDRYPISMVCSGSGSAVNPMDGLGYVPILAVMKEAKKPLISDGLCFQTDITGLSVEFYDFRDEKVIFTRDTLLHLFLRFPHLVEENPACGGSCSCSTCLRLQNKKKKK